MIRVLHVPCDLAGGGAERMVLALCERASPGFLHAVAPVHATGPLRPLFEDAGIALHDLDRTRGRPGVGAVMRLARLATQFDVIHTHLWAGDLWGRLGAGLARHPAVVTTEHNTRAEAAWRQRVGVALSPLSTVVVGVSDAAADIARAAGVPRDKVRVIRNGVDLSGFVPRPPRDGPVRTVLGLGRLVPQKGFDLLAEAVASLPDLTLELVGEGEQAEALARAGAHLHGWVPDVRAHLAAADVVAMPSRWEGFGLVAVEAMACGVPVLASDIPGLAQVVGHAALRVAPDDVEAITAGLRRLCAEPDLRRQLSLAGPERAKQFDIQATVRAYEALYEEVLDSVP